MTDLLIAFYGLLGLIAFTLALAAALIWTGYMRPAFGKPRQRKAASDG